MQPTDISAATDDAVRQTRSFVTDQLDTQSTRIGKGLTATADAIDRFGAYLQTTDGETLIVDFEDFARARPWVIAGAALTAGFAASRVFARYGK